MSTTKKILDLRPGEDGVNVRGRVLDAGDTRVVETRSGTRTLSEVTLGDETGRVTLTLWGEHAGTLEPDQVVEIQNGFTTVYRGRVQLNVGSRGAVRVLSGEDFVGADQIPDEFPEAPEDYQPRRRGGYRRYGYRSQSSSYRRPKW